MKLIEVVFLFFSIQLLSSALVILFTRNVVYAAIALMSTLLGVAALFVLAGSDLLAVVQLVVYVGGVLILLLFGVLYTYRDPESYFEKKHVLLSIVTVVVIAAGLLFLLSDLSFNYPTLSKVPSDKAGITRAAGQYWITSKILIFEVVAVFLLVVLVGAGWIASKVLDKSKTEA
ncbi:NADH-quinone oxidoreductase subunit J family protein [Cytophaga aurantiaca]|uniref:NADH-quinone oxidoreductase subunit J family protein n=1 Tax=Cytophaga aurantiaca TaxID=29530 RepID=UPI00036D99A7|nr:NADH-quinone oxidoreductase subunit J [Cytophaga aurantiaca]